MAFTRAGNRDAFLERSGYLDIEDLQRAIESGGLLRRYDLDTPQNRTRYHRVPPLVGGASLAPNTSADPTLDHLAVTPLDPATATSPGYNLGAMLLQYVPLRDCFYHQDKQREVAKGLDDLYKELQRVQNNVAAPHPTNPGLVVTTKRKLTAAEAGKIIGQRRYHASRATLEQLAVDLGYVGEVDVESPVPVPYGSTAPTPLAIPGAPAYRTPTLDAIRAAYQQPLSLTNAVQRIPEGVLAVIRDTALISGAIAGSGLTAGAAIAYGCAKGGQIVAGLAASGISHLARRGASDYITSEDGLQNFAQFTGKVGGLAAYSATASLATATLAVGWVTGTLAGSAVTRYVANRKRQHARDLQRQLEVDLQNVSTPGAMNPAPAAVNPARVAEIQAYVLSAERYEAASAACDIASLLGSVGGSLYAAFGGSGITIPGGTTTSDAPIIDMTSLKSEQHGLSFKSGDTMKYTVDVDDKPDFGDAIKDVRVAINRPDGSVVTEHLYVNGWDDKISAFFGDSHTTDKGSFDANTKGWYKMTFTASDTQGHTTEKVYGFTITEDGATPVTQLPPAPSQSPAPHSGGSGNGTSPIPGTTDYAENGWDIRRTYDDHGHLDKHCDPSSYKGGAAHESSDAFTFNNKSGHVNLDIADCDKHHVKTDAHGIHPDGKHDYRIAFEGYKLEHGKVVLADELLFQIDQNGNYKLPDSLDLTQYSGYQVGLVDVLHEGNNKLCLEFIASTSVDNNPNDSVCGYLVEPEEACHVSSAHGSTGHSGLQITPPHYEPSHFVCEPGDFKFHFNGLTHYPSIGDEAHFMARGMGGGMLYTLETPGSYNLYHVGPGAICVDNNILLPHEMSWLRLDGVDLATGTRDTFGFGSMQHSVSAVAPQTDITIDSPIIPRPVPGIGGDVNDFGYNPFPGLELDESAEVPRPVPTMGDGVHDFGAQPFEGFTPDAPADVSRPVPSIGGDVNDFGAQPFEGLDLSANTPSIHEGILYVDNEAIQAFLRSQYEDIEYKNVA
jgi:hypothetical protein